ncbi:hypothetical protein [Priestia megaterium]|uniref:hypothetical protein n=1 Tax=Priestia megaterium TaxID=1404 RepID=UPI001DCEC925|nr:hypothetical protein [Priestia megaterium]CAH0304394.1 hypothetical protein SRABI82_04671 [Priestia megaterium]
MKIRILKSSDPHYWYAHHIGEVFDVHIKNNGTREYDVITNDIYRSGIVQFSDAEEVIEHKSQLYRKVDRPVREGDTVLITKFDGDSVYIIRSVEALVNTFHGDFRITPPYKGEYYFDSDEEECVVLEPIESPIQPSAPSYAEVSELLHEATSDFNEGVDELTEKYDNTLRNLSDDVVEHNGKQYRKVKRQANVGELVVVVEDFGYGKIGEVHSVTDDDHILCGITTDKAPLMNHSRYNVLELVEQSGQTELDLLANLAQEVAELKRQLQKPSPWALDSDLRNLHRKVVGLDESNDVLIDRMNDLEDRLDENEKDVEEVIGRMNDLGDGVKAASVVPVAVIEKVIAELSSREDKSDDLCDTYEVQRNEELAQFHDGKALAFMEAIELLKEALRNG